ncbi:MAG: (Fe-S)-binding protein [Candidatus Methanoperedens sp.]|nr:(Fe-S)-binding protein [Candidatus Methanoperedens sp.]MCE8428919.1 (Fe-S)-binding protein [Candidatus Methanoperedens sp.]
MSNVQSCYQCGKCTSICPMRRVSKTSPRSSIYNSNVYGLETNGIWTCLTCGLCPMECPQQVDFLTFVREERQGKRPLEVAHLGVFTEFAELSSKLDGARHQKSDSEYGYFPGCVDQFGLFLHDVKTNFGEITTSSMKLLDKIGIKPQIMDMKCCGHDVLWQGKKDVFDRLKKYNIDHIKESGIETLITGCAECYRTFSKDYGLGIKVVHISELLDKLGLKINADVTYHDPCRLGRHMGMYDAPRKALTANGVTVKEMEHSKENALCCGVSSFMNCNEQTKALRIARMNEAEATGAKTLITTCSKCLAHFNCLKTEKDAVKKYDIDVVDLSVFLARQLEAGK